MSTLILLTLLSCFAYAGATLIQMGRLAGCVKCPRAIFLLLASIAVLTHAVLLHRWIDVGFVQNLSLSNVFSLVAWLVSLLLVILALVKPVAVQAALVFPVALLSVVLVLLFPGEHLVDTAAAPAQLVHILLSVLAVSVLCIAGIQALILVMQVRELRAGRLSIFMQALPSLEAMEHLLMGMLHVGFLLLTAVIMLGAWLFWPTLVTSILWVTMLLVMAAWCIFAFLLLVYYGWGWRGQRVVYCTLSGVVLLASAAFLITG